MLQEIVKKKEKKLEFAIITNLENGVSCIFEKDKPIDSNFEKYKGFGMGLFVEIMSACLTGSNLGIEASSFANDQGGPPGTGQFFIAINPEKYSNTFEDKIEKIIKSIRSQEKARVPGSKRISNNKTNINKEISIKEELYNKIISLSK